MAKKPKSLRSAIAAGDVDRIRELAAEGIDLGKVGRGDGLTALAAAVEAGSLPVVAALLAAGAHPDRGGIEVPLAIAAGNGALDVLGALLAAGADPNQPGEEGRTPLMSALTPEVAVALLRAGARAEAADDDGETALDAVANRGLEAAFDVLAPHYPTATVEAARPHLADAVRHRQRENNPAGKDFVLAAQAGKLDTVRAALAAGVDVETRIGCGETALHRAAYFGNVEVVAELLAAGADPRARSDSDETALEMATRRGLPDVVRLLKAAGG